MSSLFYDAFGLELLRAGANCVIGPQVDLPVPFAARYAEELFTRFLAGNRRLGDAVQDLTRRCALEWHNPLGLIISREPDDQSRTTTCRDSWSGP